MYIRQSFYIIKLGVGMPVRIALIMNLGMLEESYRFQTWHVPKQ